MKIRVYTPTAGKKWTLYETPALAAPVVWLLWLLRGIRARLWGAPLGRRVALADMQRHHPGKRDNHGRVKCLCGGSGVLETTRSGQLGVQFCARMLTAFKKANAHRIRQHRNGAPHWIRGFAPEDVVGEPAEVVPRRR